MIEIICVLTQGLKEGLKVPVLIQIQTFKYVLEKELVE